MDTSKKCVERGHLFFSREEGGSRKQKAAYNPRCMRCKMDRKTAHRLRNLSKTTSPPSTKCAPGTTEGTVRVGTAIRFSMPL